MMMLQLVRKLHVGLSCSAAEKSLLASLRKRTGYSISNCKKALSMHNDDLNKAEAWLHGEAQKMGWDKATKLAGRDAAQGLIAVKYDNAHGVLVEVNCETDFVARNEKFQTMIREAADSCYKFAHTHLQSKGPITKLSLDSEQLGELLTADGQKLKEKLVLMVGSLGENALLRRAECWKANSDDVKIAAYSHPVAVNFTDYSSGKYGALLAYKQGVENKELGVQLCQHIVGLNPQKIGNPESDKPVKDSDEETCLIHQEYLLEPGMTISEVLKEYQVEVLDYIRFKCGEAAEVAGVGEQKLENVQTLQ